MTPLVSVILPSYNHAPYLPARLDSIFDQLHHDYEVLILDDCSTDGSDALLKHYEHHPKVAALVLNETNAGPFGQWRAGLERARGEYIWIAESDDVAEPSFLSELVRVLEANPAVGVAYCQSLVIDADGAALFDNRRWTDDLDPELWRHPFQMSGMEALRRFFPFKNVIPNVSAALFRKRLFEQVDLEFTGFRYAGDWLVWAQLLRASDLAFEPRLLNRFRLHAHTTRRRTRAEQRARYLGELYTVVQRIAGYAALDEVALSQAHDRLARRTWSELGVTDLLNPSSLRVIRGLTSKDPELPLRLLKLAARAGARKVGLR